MSFDFRTLLGDQQDAPSGKVDETFAMSAADALEVSTAMMVMDETMSTLRKAAVSQAVALGLLELVDGKPRPAPGVDPAKARLNVASTTNAVVATLLGFLVMMGSSPKDAADALRANVDLVEPSLASLRDMLSAAKGKDAA